MDIEVRFSLPIGYDNEFVTLSDIDQVLAFQLEPGTHTAKSQSVELGIAHRCEGRRLLGQFSFEYTYEPDRQVITVCGTDFQSERGMCLATVPVGTVEVCRQWAGGGGFVADDLTAHPRWNYRTVLLPGLEDVFKGLVRTVNERMIEALEAQPGLTVQVRKHPPELSAEEHQKFLVVYRDGRFHGFHEPGRQCGPRDEVFTVDSVFGGEVTLSYAESFANVIGSTPDPEIAGLSWIQLWANQFNTYPVICTSYQSNGFNCGSSLVGGHVIKGTHASSMPKGSNSVWIMPICAAHNNNDNVYMQALKYLKGIWLHNYLGH